MTPGVLIVIVVVVFLVFGIGLSRRQSERKKEAIQDLQREKEALGSVSIQALVEEEAADLGLAGISGADGIPTVILLKVWKSNSSLVERCPSREQLRYQLAEGVDPQNATEPDVTLVCDGELASPPPRDTPPEDRAKDDVEMDEHESEEE
jgi:hypothetical protein